MEMARARSRERGCESEGAIARVRVRTRARGNDSERANRACKKRYKTRLQNARTQRHTTARTMNAYTHTHTHSLRSPATCVRASCSRTRPCPRQQEGPRRGPRRPLPPPLVPLRVRSLEARRTTSKPTLLRRQRGPLPLQEALEGPRARKCQRRSFG